MHKIEFTLKQHTPLIHFQHDQAGATLRATEVKPKLDFFLMKKLLNNPNIPDYKIMDEFFQKASKKLSDKTDHPWKNWLEGKGENEHVAFDYKLRFTNEGKYFEEIIPYSQTPDGKLRPNFPCVFGNVDTEDKCKYVTFAASTKAVIMSFSKPLCEEIEKIISDFFLNYNFGFRQSKGFGSFYLDEEDKYYYRPLTQYHFSVASNIRLDTLAHFKSTFQTIDLFYKSLRSGINTSKYGGIYFKSMMFLYAKSTNQQWDKKTLRESFYSHHELFNTIKMTRTDDPEGTVKYNAPKKENLLFRDLLGLSSEQDWMGYGKPKKDKYGQIFQKNGEPIYKSDTLEKKSTNNEIERFQSPITFKPIKRLGENIYDIYLIIRSIPEMYKGQAFNITSKSYGSSKIMSIPKSFDLKLFLDYCFRIAFPTDRDFQNHVGSTNQDATTLKRIYSELRNSQL